MAKADENAVRFLAHPVYLDVPMMVSFLAALDDGVAYSSEVAERLTSVREGEGDANLKAGVPSLAQWLGLTLSAEGRYKRRASKDESVEAKLIREHTSASLFNILRHRLVSTANVKTFGVDQDLSAINVGDIVEVQGVVTGDPLRRVMGLMSIIAPFLGWNLDDDSQDQPHSKAKTVGTTRRKAVQSNTTSTEQPSDDRQAFEIVRILKRDMANAKVVDLMMKTVDDRSIILAASNDYMTDATEQYMLAGAFTAIGKVTQVLHPGETISFLRRTAFVAIEATGGTGVEDAFSGIASAMPGLNLPDLTVAGPGLQVLPLAIYV